MTLPNLTGYPFSSGDTLAAQTMTDIDTNFSNALDKRSGQNETVNSNLTLNGNNYFDQNIFLNGIGSSFPTVSSVAQDGQLVVIYDANLRRSIYMLDWSNVTSTPADGFRVVSASHGVWRRINDDLPRAFRLAGAIPGNTASGISFLPNNSSDVGLGVVGNLYLSLATSDYQVYSCDYLVELSVAMYGYYNAISGPTAAQPTILDWSLIDNNGVDYAHQSGAFNYMQMPGFMVNGGLAYGQQSTSTTKFVITKAQIDTLLTFCAAHSANPVLQLSAKIKSNGNPMQWNTASVGAITQPQFILTLSPGS